MGIMTRGRWMRNLTVVCLIHWDNAQREWEGDMSDDLLRVGSMHIGLKKYINLLYWT
jgi:hypothetical protein